MYTHQGSCYKTRREVRRPSRQSKPAQPVLVPPQAHRPKLASYFN